jgi:integrase
MKDKKQIKKTRAVHVTGKTDAEKRKEAERALAEFTVEIERGLVIDGKKMTFKEFVDRWLKDYAETNLAPKTLFRYKEILDSRILPSIGHIKIDQLRPTHIIEFENMLREDGIRKDGRVGGLSEKTILQHHRIISSILNDAVQWQAIFSSPAARVKPPKVKKNPAKCYDEDQMWALLDALEQAPPEDLKYRVIVDLALGTGLRRGEIMGLEWKDINLDFCTLDVRQASQYLPGQGTFIKDPKNETSKRLISVPAGTIALLKKWKVQQAEQRLKIGDQWSGGDWVFTAWNGQKMHPDTISKWFPGFLKDNKLPHIPFHGLRHTSATLLIAEGSDIREVSGRLGHSNTSTTGDIYAHFLKKADQAAAEKLDNLMTRRKRGTSSKSS